MASFDSNRPHKQLEKVYLQLRFKLPPCIVKLNGVHPLRSTPKLGTPNSGGSLNSGVRSESGSFRKLQSRNNSIPKNFPSSLLNLPNPPDAYSQLLNTTNVKSNQ